MNKDLCIKENSAISMEWCKYEIKLIFGIQQNSTPSTNLHSLQYAKYITKC